MPGPSGSSWRARHHIQKGMGKAWPTALFRRPSSWVQCGTGGCGVLLSHSKATLMLLASTTGGKRGHGADCRHDRVKPNPSRLSAEIDVTFANVTRTPSARLVAAGQRRHPRQRLERQTVSGGVAGVATWAWATYWVGPRQEGCNRLARRIRSDLQHAKRASDQMFAGCLEAPNVWCDARWVDYSRGSDET